MKVLAWYIDLDGNKNDYTINYTCPYDIRKCGILIIDTQMVVNKMLLDTLVCKEREGIIVNAHVSDSSNIKA
jgi:hypothetical protein